MDKTGTVSDFIDIAKVILKQNGFKKSNLTWRKENQKSIFVFNVQKSSWGGDRFYANIGVYFKSLGNEINPTENRCHVQTRIPTDCFESAVLSALGWFENRKFLADAKKLADSDSLKGLVHKDLRENH